MSEVLSLYSLISCVCRFKNQIYVYHLPVTYLHHILFEFAHLNSDCLKMAICAHLSLYTQILLTTPV